MDASSPVQTIVTGTRLKQSEIDFLLHALYKYNKHFVNNKHLSPSPTQTNTVKMSKNTQNFMKGDNHLKHLSDDVVASTDDVSKRAFVPPLANALSKSEMKTLHDELGYLRNKVMQEVKQAKIRRSGKEIVDEKFVPSISVGNSFFFLKQFFGDLKNRKIRCSCKFTRIFRNSRTKLGKFGREKNSTESVKVSRT